MGQVTIKPFIVKIINENGYNRLYVTHPNFKGRIKKRVGFNGTENIENTIFHLKYDLENHFATNEISKEAVAGFVSNFVALRIKFTASIFDYFEEFIANKKKAVNKHTKNRLVKPTITSYESARKYFEKFLIKSRLTPHPSVINQEVLDNFYYFIEGKHNYKTKLHRRLKAFVTFLDGKRGIQIDPSYKLSVFTEEYDNQDPEEDDIALTIKDVQKLISLRKRIYNGEVEFPMYLKNNKIPENLQQYQFNMKKENLIHCLDCFLFMISTGQYHSDIMKTSVNLINQNGLLQLKYRRAKNGSLCKAIPIKNDDVFIGKEIIDHYKIKSGTNFPLNLSNTHFNKHLERISELAGLKFKLNNKMARKTFASILYYDRQMPIHLLQVLLGHKNVNNTMHYLRISDESLTCEVDKFMYGNFKQNII